MNFCMRCGARLKEGDAFCPMCGNKVAELPPREPVPVQPQQASQPPQAPVQSVQEPPVQAPEQPMQTPERPVQQPAQPAYPEAYQRPSELPKAIPVSPEEEFEMLEMPRQSPYARPAAGPNYGQSRPSAPGYGQNRPSSPIGYGGQQPANYEYGRPQPGYGPYGGNRPAAGNGYSRQQPAGYGYGQRPGYGEYGGNRIPERKVKNQGLLKLLSFVFALGLLAAAIGLGSGMYLDRSVKETLADTNMDLEIIGMFGKSSSRDSIDQIEKDRIPAIIREDTDGYQSTMNAGAYVSLGASITNDAILDEMKSANEAASKEYGYRWLIMKAGARSDILLIAGGAAAGISLVLWFVLGGTKAGISRTTIMPLLVMFLIWAVCIILVALLVKPVNLWQVDKWKTLLELF